MNVYFLTFGKKENSTAQPTIPITLDPVAMQLKQSCSVRSPILESKQYWAENYCYIPTWNRYYYIREKTYINGAWTYTLECDYLATWKTQIGNTSMLMVRASQSYDGNIVDKMYPLLGTTYTDEIKFGDKTTFANGYFVISVVGANSTSGGQVLYQMTPVQFQSVLQELFVYASSGVTWGSVSEGVVNSVMNPTQYITSCRWYPKPFEVVEITPGVPVTATIKAGLWQSTTQVNLVSTSNYSAREYYAITLPKHNQAGTLGRNMNLSPMTRYVLELGVFGVTDLDTTLLYNCDYVDVYIYADPYTGIGKARIIGRFFVAGDSNPYYKLIACLDAKYGVDIPLAQGGGFEVSNFLSGTALKRMGLNLLASTGSENGKNTLFGLLGSADESMNGINFATSSIGPLIAHNMDKYLYGYYQQRVIGDNDNNGRPLMTKTTPATLTGFMQAMKGVVSLPASDEEMNIVNRYMESGFYYE